MATTTVSFNPDAFVAGGGLIDDVDVEFVSMRAVVWDYNGKAPEALALKAALRPLNSTETLDQYWSAGSPEDFEILDDGRRLHPRGEVTGLRKTTNAAELINSLKSCGFTGWSDDLGKMFDGLQAHVNQKPAPKRAGLESHKAGGFEPTVLHVTKILRLSSGKKPSASSSAAPVGAPVAGTPALAPATAAPAVTDDATRARAMEVLATIMAEQPEIRSAPFKVAVFKAAMKEPEVRKLLQSGEFQREALGKEIPA